MPNTESPKTYGIDYHAELSQLQSLGAKEKVRYIDSLTSDGVLWLLQTLYKKDSTTRQDRKTIRSQIDDTYAALVQKSLNLLGATPALIVDGKYGANTKWAVLQFMKHNNVYIGSREQGRAGPDVFGKIEELFVTSSKEIERKTATLDDVVDNTVTAVKSEKKEKIKKISSIARLESEVVSTRPITIDQVDVVRKNLRSRGLRLRSSSKWYTEDGKDRWGKRTSLIWLQQSTISWVKNLMEDFHSQYPGAIVDVTWATENEPNNPHVDGKISHWGGHKFDFSVHFGDGRDLASFLGLSQIWDKATYMVEYDGVAQKIYAHREPPAWDYEDHLDVVFYPPTAIINDSEQNLNILAAQTKKIEWLSADQYIQKIIKQRPVFADRIKKYGPKIINEAQKYPRLRDHIPSIFAQIDVESDRVRTKTGDNGTSFGGFQISKKKEYGHPQKFAPSYFDKRIFSDVDQNIWYGLWYLDYCVQTKWNFYDGLDLYNGASNLTEDVNNKYSTKIKNDKKYYTIA